MKRIYVLLLLLLLNYTPSIAKDTTYEGLSNFTRVLDMIERNYVEEVDPEKLTNSAIDGIVCKTLDPYPHT
jgi:hypothetical protein